MHNPEGTRSLTSAIKGTHAQAGRRTLIDKIIILNRPIIGVDITTAQQLASSRHISAKEIFSIPRTCNFNSK